MSAAVNIPTKSRRRYSDRQRAQVLAVLGVNNGNLSATARATGIPLKTIADWRDSLQREPELAELHIEEKGNLAEKLDRIAHQCAGLLPGKLPESTVHAIVGAMSQSIEKGLLLRGQPTVITSDVSSPAERAERAAELLNRGRLRLVEKTG